MTKETNVDQALGVNEVEQNRVPTGGQKQVVILQRLLNFIKGERIAREKRMRLKKQPEKEKKRKHRKGIENDRKKRREN